MRIEQDEVQSRIMQVLDVMLEEWDDELDEPVEPESKLVEDVGFASIDFVQLAVAIEAEFKMKMGFQTLLMQDGAYVEDLSIAEVSAFVFDKVNSVGSPDTQPAPQQKVAPVAPNVDRLESVESKVTREKMDEFRSIIRPCSPRENDGGEKNRPAVFVLSPPRSGSTLLRIMLAGCPQLFVPPELHLLSYADMSERLAALDNTHNRHLLEGTIRALMQLKGWDAETARAFCSDSEAQKQSCKSFYDLLQKEAGEALLVDKTPTYAVNKQILDRAEEDFQDAKYIHLVRHPCGTMRSYEESKLTRMMPLMNESDFSGRELAEMTWLTCHQNTFDFTKDIPENRYLQVQYEKIVQQPEVEMRRICEFLDVPYHPDMINPYQDNEQRMADGVDAASKMSGDLKFHLHQGIDPAAAFRWQEFYSENILGDITKEVARKCGYDIK